MDQDNTYTVENHKTLRETLTPEQQETYDKEWNQTSAIIRKCTERLSKGKLLEQSTINFLMEIIHDLK